MRTFRRLGLRTSTAALVVALIVALMPAALAGHAIDGADVKVTNDNNNVDGGTPNPSFDAQNRQANETSIATSPVNPDIVVAAANDYGMVPVFGDAWLGFYVSDDDGASWFNTMVPGFPSDTSPSGLASPLQGLDGAGDPVVSFDADGNLYLGGISFNRNFQPDELPVDTVAFIAKYDYTPGSPGGTSTPSSAANPPHFTYAFTTIVGEGAVGFGVPSGQPFGFAGLFPDKNWHEVDTSSTSPCQGNIYYTFTKFTGLAGAFPIVFARSTDGGESFSSPKPISNKGADGTNATQGSHVDVASDGTVYVSYRTFPTSSDPTVKLQVVRSDDCGRHFGKPVTAAVFNEMPRQAAGLSFRTPTESWLAVDDTDPNTVYVSFMGLAGSPANADIFVARSIDGAFTWGAPVKVNDDATNKHQFWPTIGVSNGALHVAWYDFRNSPISEDPAVGNDVLDVFYASSNADGVTYPAFSHNVQVTDVGHNPNCRMFGAGTVGFHGDYIELDARFVGANHVVHVAWADNRDVNPCDLDPEPGPDSNNTGNRNQNIYADRLIVAP
jgi:hypothetical protein